MRTNATTRLENLYANVGLPCNIEAGPFGLVVYSATPAMVRSIVKKLAEAPHAKGVATETTDPIAEPDEDPETRFWARLDFSWSAFEAACH